MQILAGPFGIYGENGRQILHAAKSKPEKKSSNIWIILKAWQKLLSFIKHREICLQSKSLGIFQ